MKTKYTNQIMLATLLTGGIAHSSLADTFVCRYKSDFIKTTITAPTSTIIKLKDIDFAGVNGIPATNFDMLMKTCPMVNGSMNNSLIDVYITKNDNKTYPILDKSIVDGKTTDFTTYINKFAKYFLSDNLSNSLQTMTDSRSDWKNYTQNFTSSANVYLMTGNNVFTIHGASKVKSDIFAEVPTDYTSTQKMLTGLIASKPDFNGQTITLKEANLISAFITRYDTIGGLSSVLSLLLDSELSINGHSKNEYFSLRGSNYMNQISQIYPAHMFISYSKLNNGNIKVNLKYLATPIIHNKITKSFYGAVRENSIEFSVNVTIDTKQSKEGGRLYITTAATEPIEELIFGDNMAYGTDLSSFSIAQWIISKSTRQTVSFERPNNTDNFRVLSQS